MTMRMFESACNIGGTIAMFAGNVRLMLAFWAAAFVLEGMGNEDMEVAP